jgi:hypothetical protein
MRLFTEQEYEDSRLKGFLELRCDVCNRDFVRTKKNIQTNCKKGYNLHCCSSLCTSKLAHIGKGDNGRVDIVCKNCSKVVSKKYHEANRVKNSFCSQSCSAIYFNATKKFDCRVSKLEKWLQSKLTEAYPNICFLFNKREAINSELDIYIPELKLAFELNGIFHYEPIYGSDTLERTRNNDDRKFQACAECGISLCVIDSSKQRYFKESTSWVYFDIIKNIIDQKMRIAGYSKTTPVLGEPPS